MDRPPWILASIICCLNALHAGKRIYFPQIPRPTLSLVFIVDKTGERFFHIAGWWWAVILGYIIALSTFSIAGRYVSLFLMACGDVGQSCSQLSTLPTTTDSEWKKDSH